MRVLVIGFGHAGRRHAAAAQALGHEAAALRRAPAPGENEVAVFADPDAALAWQPDGVVVATPASEHLHGLRWAVEHGLPALVEKPLADRPDGLAETLAAARAPVGVAYNLRFHPALEAIATAVQAGRVGRLFSIRAEVGQYLADWHPGERLRPGSGALAELSHELELVRWIAGEVLSCNGVRARVSDLPVDVDDVADIVCRHAGGAVSSVHADFLDRSYNRRSRWVGAEASIEWRSGGPVTLERGGDRESMWDDPAYDLAESYRAQLADFLDAAAAGREPRVPGVEGLRVVEIVAGVVAEA